MLIFQKDPAEFEMACPQVQGGDFYSKQKKKIKIHTEIDNIDHNYFQSASEIFV